MDCTKLHLFLVFYKRIVLKAVEKQFANALFAAFRSALREDRLTLVQSGSSSPCLDLRWVDAINAPRFTIKDKRRKFSCQ